MVTFLDQLGQTIDGLLGGIPREYVAYAAIAIILLAWGMYNYISKNLPKHSDRITVLYNNQQKLHHELEKINKRLIDIELGEKGFNASPEDEVELIKIVSYGTKGGMPSARCRIPDVDAPDGWRDLIWPLNEDRTLQDREKLEALASLGSGAFVENGDEPLLEDPEQEAPILEVDEVKQLLLPAPKGISAIEGDQPDNFKRISEQLNTARQQRDETEAEAPIT